MEFVREFKDAHGFKDGWYYRLGDGHPWIGPFVTAHMASRAREHVTGNVQDVQSKPQWLKITTSVALGPLSLMPPRGGPGFKMASMSRHAGPVALPRQSNARPQLALSARRPAVRDESVVPQPARVPRRRDR